MLAYDRMRPRPRADRPAKIPDPAVRTGLDHVQSDEPLERLDGTPDVQRLLLEAGEHAVLHRAAAVHHQQIGIPLGCQIVVTDRPEAVRHAGIEVVTDGDGIGRLRTGGEYGGPLQVLHPTVEPHLHPQPRGLSQQGRNQRAGAGSTFHHAEQGLVGVDGVRLAPPIEGRPGRAGQGSILRAVPMPSPCRTARTSSRVVQFSRPCRSRWKRYPTSA
ncbi:MAG: hypothetical protein WAT23_06460, partial [Chromatiaceae bacterium]